MATETNRKRGNPKARPIRNITLLSTGDISVRLTDGSVLMLSVNDYRNNTSSPGGKFSPYPTELAQIATRLARRFSEGWQVKAADGTWTTMPERVQFIHHTMRKHSSVNVAVPLSADSYHDDDESLATSETTTETTTTKEDTQVGSLEQIITDLVDQRIRNTAAQLNMDELLAVVNTTVAERLSEVGTTRTEIKFPERTVTLDKHTHPMFPKVLAALTVARQSTKWPYLVGPAGTGKSTMAEHLAEALDVPFYSVSCQPGMMMHDLIGYKRPTDGVYDEPELVTLMRNGGTGLLDEVDKAHPGILAGMNGALAQGYITLPTGERLKISDKFYFIAGANTFGTGATAQYVGSTQLDAATLNRFVRIPVDYDRQYELSVAKSFLGEKNGKAWCAQVEIMRTNRDSHKIDAIISTRDLIGCAVQVGTGAITPAEAVEWNLLGGLSKDQQTRLLSGTNLDCLEAAK